MKKVLFFQHMAVLGGAGLCLYSLIMSLRDKIEPVIVSMADGPLMELFRAEGIKVYIEPRIKVLLPNTNSESAWRISAFASLLYYHRAVRLAEYYCRKEHPDIVHINTAVLMHLAKGAKQAKVNRVILHVREHWDVKWWDLRGYNRKDLIHKYTDQIIAISKTASNHFGFKEKTKVIYDWPDFLNRDGEIDIRREYNISHSKKIILLMGGRTPIKGSKMAMQAMKYVKDENAVMLVLGSKADNNSLKQKIRAILRLLHIKTYGLTLDYLAAKSNNRIIMTGVIKNVKNVIWDAAIVVCPFTTPHFAMPILEAGCLGRPVIATDTEYSQEIIKNGRTGIIVKAGDVNALADAINELLDSPEQAEEMGRSACDYIKYNFVKEKSILELRNLFL